MLPARILFVSADMGEGHNAAARSLAGAVTATWPACETRQVDALRAMGGWFARVARAVYAFQLRRAPWTYQIAYDALDRWSWLSGPSKRLLGAWAGRALSPAIAAFAPDLIISTYPIGSAGLAWLRRNGRLKVPVATWITDFNPHPLWVHKDVDVHCVMHRLAAEAVISQGVRGRVHVAAPTVAPQFFERDAAAARRALGLSGDAFVVLLTGGAWGVGTLDLAVAALRTLGDRCQLVVICGRNERMRADLEALGEPRGRLVPLGYVDNMAEWMAASDVVVNNAGGVTSLEAFASARPLALFDPIAGHGRANALMMGNAGLAVVCPDADSLLREVRALSGDPERTARIRLAERDHLAGKSLGADLRFLAGTVAAPRRRGGRTRRGVAAAWRAVFRRARRPARAKEGAEVGWTRSE
ncbi:MAG TPA: glycosyltransferase [Planctomycetota bacterium]|nr:glycosyltransferase [Planctomycetota bacterium]